MNAALVPVSYCIFIRESEAIVDYAGPYDCSVSKRTVRYTSAAKPIRLSSLYNKNLKLKKRSSRAEGS